MTVATAANHNSKSTTYFEGDTAAAAAAAAAAATAAAAITNTNTGSNGCASAYLQQYYAQMNAAAAYSPVSAASAAAAAAAVAAAAAAQQQQQHQLNQDYYSSISNAFALPTSVAVSYGPNPNTPLFNLQNTQIDGCAGGGSNGMLVNINGLYYPASALTHSQTNNATSQPNISGGNLTHSPLLHQQQQFIQQQIQQQQVQQQQQQLFQRQQQQLATPILPPAGFTVPKVESTIGVNGAPSVASFEGVPIFIVPQTGTLSFNALQRANEFKLAQLAGNLMSPLSLLSPKVDTSKHFHVFVGDLSSEVDNKTLKEAFDKCGTISEAKVIRDPQSLKSRGYGFVSFPDKKDAQKAIDEMNGAMVGRRAVRTNWASRRAATNSGSVGGASEDEKASTCSNTTTAAADKSNQSGSYTTARSDSTASEPNNNNNCGAGSKPAALQRLLAATDDENTTVYVGNLNGGSPPGFDLNAGETRKQDEIREAFKRFGEIKEIRLFPVQNYGFVIFEAKESAANAILEMNGSELTPGVRIRCSWGRAGAHHDANANVSSSMSALATAQLLAAHYAASQNNQSIAAATQNANVIFAAQIANQQQQHFQQQRTALQIAAAQQQMALPVYAAANIGVQNFDAGALNAASCANSLYNAPSIGGTWHG